jgi:hypothetical protein
VRALELLIRSFETWRNQQLGRWFSDLSMGEVRIAPHKFATGELISQVVLIESFIQLANGRVRVDFGTALFAEICRLGPHNFVHHMECKINEI